MSRAFDPDREISTGELLGIMTFQTAAFVMIGAALWRASGRPFSAMISPDPGQLTDGLLLAVALISVGVVTVFGLPRYADWMVRAQAETYSFLKDKLSAVPIIWISICAGVGEEVLFRAGLQTVLTDHIGPYSAIAISSALFAAIHMAKPLIAVILFFIGILFGVVFWMTGSLITVVVGHAVYDVLALGYLQHRLHEMGYFDDAPLDDTAEPTA